MPLKPETIIPEQTPTACLQQCPKIPSADDIVTEGDYKSWVFDLIETFSECRRMHEECRRSK